jgi:hypothetical protein
MRRIWQKRFSIRLSVSERLSVQWHSVASGRLQGGILVTIRAVMACGSQ